MLFGFDVLYNILFVCGLYNTTVLNNVFYEWSWIIGEKLQNDEKFSQNIVNIGKFGKVK